MDRNTTPLAAVRQGEKQLNFAKLYSINGWRSKKPTTKNQPLLSLLFVGCLLFVGWWFNQFPLVVRCFQAALSVRSAWPEPSEDEGGGGRVVEGGKGSDREPAKAKALVTK